MRHFQINNRPYCLCPVADVISFNVRTIQGVKKVDFNQNLPIDQFFSQKQNLKNGFVDTSPAAFDDPQFAKHVSPVGAEKSWPSDTPDSVIHSHTLSKKVQTVADLAKLKDSRPVEPLIDDKSDIVNNQSSESNAE